MVSGSVERQGSGYGLSIKATQAITGVVITSATGRAASKDRVLSVATGLADKVREALGDETSDDAKRFAMDTLSATSLDVVRHYAAGMQALSNGKSEDALQRFSEAVTLDPKFGIGYHLMAVSSRNLDRYEDAQKYSKRPFAILTG